MPSPGSGSHQAVPLHDKPVFDTHVLAARPRHHDQGSSRGAKKPATTKRWERSAMDASAYRVNKILGLVLGTALFLQAVRIIDQNFSGNVEKRGPEVAAKEAQPQTGAAAAGPIDTLLAS